MRRAPAGLLAILLIALALPAPARALDPVDPPWPPPGAGVELPACRVGDLATERRALGDWRSSVLDTERRLPASYAPRLTTLAAAGWGGAEGGTIRVRALPEMLAALRRMRADARQAGLRLAVMSGYRSAALQARLFSEAVRRAGRTQALRSVARPGHSEHQLGTTIDFKTRGGPAPWSIRWERTREGRWLAANATRYGFVLSYPPGASELTCYKYEPWHLRYVGAEIAARVAAEGRTLREVLWDEQ